MSFAALLGSDSGASQGYLQHITDTFGDRALLFDLDADGVFTGRAIAEQAHRVAHYLSQSHGVGAGDVVAVLSMNRVDTVYLFFGCSLLGAILMPLSPIADPTQTLTNLQLKLPKVTFFERSIFLKEEILEDGKDVIGDTVDFSDLPELAKAQSVDSPLNAAPWNPTATALYCSTSGSTGKGKLCEFSHEQFIWLAIQTLATRGTWFDGRTLLLYPLGSMVGWFRTLTCLLNGWGIVISGQLSTESIDKALQGDLISKIIAPPTLLDFISRDGLLDKPAFKSIKGVWATGFDCPDSYLKPFWNKGIFAAQAYGCSEAGPCTYYPNLGQSMADVRRDGTSVGLPLPLTKVAVVDERAGSFLPQGQEGVVVVKQPKVFRGYVGDGRRSAATLGDDECIVTRDYGVFDQDGYLRVLRRLPDESIGFTPSVAQTSLPVASASVGDAFISRLRISPQAECCQYGDGFSLSYKQIYDRVRFAPDQDAVIALFGDAGKQDSTATLFASFLAAMINERQFYIHDRDEDAANSSAARVIDESGVEWSDGALLLAAADWLLISGISFGEAYYLTPSDRGVQAVVKLLGSAMVGATVVWAPSHI